MGDLCMKLYTKATTSLLFVVLCIFSYLYSKGDIIYFSLLLAGLLCSLLGDVFLGIQSKDKRPLNKMFLLGLISFSFTHVFYISSFNYIYPLNIKDILFSLFMILIIIAFLISRKNFNFQGFFIPTCIYSILISLMFCKCISTSLLLGKSIVSLLLILGSTSFVVSDIILAFIVFDGKYTKYISILNLTTYYVGQFLIALTVIFI